MQKRSGCKPLRFVINCISSAVDGLAEKQRDKDVSPGGTPAGRAAL